MTPTAADQKNWSELLDGLPHDLRYTPLNGDKCPIDPDTGFRRKEWQNFLYLPSDLDQMNGVVKAVGLHLGPTSNGVMAVDFDGIGSEVVFQNLTGHLITELPKTIRWSSGQQGVVDREHRDQLNAIRATLEQIEGGTPDVIDV